MNQYCLRSLSLLAALLMLCALTACDKIFSPEPVHVYGQTMGTSYTVSLVGLPDNVSKTSLKAGIDAVLEDINQKMSTYRTDSEISRFNRSPDDEWFNLSQSSYDVIKESLAICELSSGAFDITVGPLVNLWGFGPENQPEKVPDADLLRLMLDRVGYQFLQLDSTPHRIKKAKNIYIDLSAIAKGYGVDKVIDYLQSLGIQNALVEVGGEVRTIGVKKPGRSWRVAIEAPTPDMRSVQKIVELKDVGMATSGDYRNFFEVDGRRYSHTLNPKTGYPVSHQLASVSVIASSSMRADGLATAILVMGEQEGKVFAEANNIAAFFIVKTGEGFSEFATEAFEQYLLVLE